MVDGVNEASKLGVGVCAAVGAGADGHLGGSVEPPAIGAEVRITLRRAARRTGSGIALMLASRTSSGRWGWAGP